MGLGEMGQNAAHKLRMMGYRVSGWSRTLKKLEGIDCYAGQVQLPAFLKSLDIVIGLLPLTPETQGIFNQHLFEQLPQGAYVINAGRGGHLIESDLLAALDSGHLSGACLDVFQEEPLPIHHPLWSHPKVVITPHCAAVSNPVNTACQIIENYRRVMRGEEMMNLVDRKRGY